MKQKEGEKDWVTHSFARDACRAQVTHGAAPQNRLLEGFSRQVLLFRIEHTAPFAMTPHASATLVTVTQGNESSTESISNCFCYQQKCRESVNGIGLSFFSPKCHPYTHLKTPSFFQQTPPENCAWVWRQERASITREWYLPKQPFLNLPSKLFPANLTFNAITTKPERMRHLTSCLHTLTDVQMSTSGNVPSPDEGVFC